MPMVETTSKKRIESQYTTLKELQEKCDSCKIFKGKKADDLFIFSVYKDYETKDGPAMVAIAKYGNTYAIYPPKYLTGEQWTVLCFLLRDVEPTDKLVVFSQEIFENLGRYSYGKQLNVQLFV